MGKVNRYKYIGSLLLFAAVVVLTGMIAANTPLYEDDMVFANVWGCSKHLICPEENFNPIAYAWEHRVIVNGRVGDMFTPLMMMVPRWCYGVLYAFCFGVILLQMMRLAQLSFRRTPMKCAWIASLAILFFPWIDVLYTRAVFFNYFPAIIFTLIALKLFIRETPARGWKLAGYIVACVLSGCWHELMPVVLFPSAVLYCIITRKITPNQWIVAASMAAGMIIVVSAPSFFNRVDQLDSLFFSPYHILLCKLNVLLLILIAIVSITTLYFRKDLKDRKRSFALVSALLLPIIPSCAIMLASLYETRMILFAMVLALSALFYSLPRGIRLAKGFSATTAILSILLFAVVLFQLSFVVFNTIKVRKASEDILRQATANPDSNVYYDLRDILANDKIWLYKTQGRSYVNRLHTWDEFADYTGSRYTYNVLPPALKNFDLSKAESIASSKGYYYYDTYLLADAPCDSTDYAFGVLEIAFDKAPTRQCRFMGTYFTDVNGKPLVYLLPYQTLIKRKKPTKVKITECYLHPRMADKVK